MSSDAEKLQQELDAARRELEEARAVIAAIRRGEADALVIETDGGPRVYTLRAADQPYRTIVETLKEGAVTITADGMILYCNEAFARLVSRDASLLIGSNFVEIAGAETTAALTAEGGRAGRECVLVCAQGRRLECQVSSTPHQADGSMIWCLLVTDLTGQALRLRYNAIVESTDDAVMSFDLNGRITSWNRAAEALFGYTAEEAIGRDADLLAPLSGVFGETLAGSKFQKDTRCAGKDGAIIDVSVTASPIRAPDGAITGLSAIMRDVTERKQAEERERLLMQEVNHRAKNMLSLVQSIARQTAAGTPKDFIERFEDRIHALSASQDLLVKSGWRNVPLESLVHAQLGLFADLVGRRIRLSGPELEIAAAAAQAIGMALHELATNAAKYAGRVKSRGLRFSGASFALAQASRARSVAAPARFMALIRL